jgi:hypothetical protein
MHVASGLAIGFDRCAMCLDSELDVFAGEFGATALLSHPRIPLPRTRIEVCRHSVLWVVSTWVVWSAPSPSIKEKSWMRIRLLGRAVIDAAEPRHHDF